MISLGFWRLGNMATMAQIWPEDWFESVDRCLMCDNQDLVSCVESAQDWFFHAVPGVFRLDRCNGCNSLVLRERPVADHLAKAYVGYYTHGSAGAYMAFDRKGPRMFEAYKRYRFEQSSSLADRLIAAIYERLPGRALRLELRYRFLPRKRSDILDYGCGSGDFLSFAQKLGHKVFGLDFDPDAVSAAQAQGVPAATLGAVDQASLIARFDHIVVNHVLEHVPDPVGMMKEFHAWLKPSGTVYMEFPHGQSEGLRRYGPYWRGLEVPRHFSVPSQAGITAAARRAGFERVEVLRQPANEAIRSSIWEQSAKAMQGDGAKAGCVEGDFPRGGSEFLSVLLRKD